MKKLLTAILTVAILLTACSFVAVAEEKVVYVQAAATGTGTESSPFGTLEEAIWALDNAAGTVKIIGNFELTASFKQEAWEGMVTITAANSDSVLSVKNSAGVIFNGPVTIKDIEVDLGKHAHFNTNGAPLIIDAGEEVEFLTEGGAMIHFPTLGNSTVEEGYLEFNSGIIPTVYVAGGYSTSYANGVMGDATFVMNGGKITTLSIAADHYQDVHTGISIGGNLNIVINGGTIAKFSTKTNTPPEIMGALNVIFNDGFTPIDVPALETVAGGTYIVKVAAGGKLMPTPEIGVFEVKANPGKIAVIGGNQVLNGKVTLTEGETEVTWVDGVQEEPIEIKLTIGDKNIVKNGVATALDVPAQIIDSRTMVPLRAIFEALGASVEWDDATKTVTSVKGDITVKLTVGTSEIIVNDTATALDVPAQIVESRTLVPVRVIAESFGCTVGWDDATKTVTITK